MFKPCLFYISLIKMKLFEKFSETTEKRNLQKRIGFIMISFMGNINGQI